VRVRVLEQSIGKKTARHWQQSFTETKAFRAGFLLLPVYANGGAKEAKVVAEHGNGWQNADVLEPA
jgi:hypothetical protein